MTDFSKTYDVEISFTDRDENGVNRKGIVKIPYMSSAQFFKFMEIPEIKELLNAKEKPLPDSEDSDTSLMVIGRKVAEIVCPVGTLEQITMVSAMELIAVILKQEADTLGLKVKGDKSLGEAESANPSLTTNDSPDSSAII